MEAGRGVKVLRACSIEAARVLLKSAFGETVVSRPGGGGCGLP